MSPVDDFWLDYFYSNFNIFYLCLAVFCVGYPIYYLIDYKDNSETNKNFVDDKNDLIIYETRKKVDILFILYLISFIPYFALIYFSIFGIRFCLFACSIVYGFDAVIAVLIYGSIIPVFPVVFIFQIIYFVMNYKKITIIKRNFIKNIIIILIVALVCSICMVKVGNTHRVNDTYIKDKKVIEDYLINEFGKMHFNEMEILKQDIISSYYTVKTPLLNYGFQIQLNDERTEVVSNKFYDKFIETYNLNGLLSNYLMDLHNIPSELDIKPTITKFDIKNYNREDSINVLFEDCYYYIRAIYLHFDNYDKEKVIDIIKDFCINYYDKLNISNLSFIVNVNNRNFARVSVYRFDKYIRLMFRGYTYSDGFSTIADETINIDLVVSDLNIK